MSGNENKEEGKRIKDAIDAFYKDSSQENLLQVMNALMESLIWIPCVSIPGGKEEAPVIQPEILKNGDQYYFPVFSGCEEMGEDRDKFSKMQKPFVEAISLARGSGGFQVSGIVVNAFTTPINLPWELLDIIEESANLQ